jgi:TPP-dependent pyruvate/acetoin dehydrogenase alpha subunit
MTKVHICESGIPCRHSGFNIEQKLILGSRTKSELISQLKLMLVIRFAENKIAEMRKSMKIGGPVHLASGQEAIPVGISKFLSKTDMVFSGHRSHAHLLALGSEPFKLFAEVLGRASGLSKGMGGSMHLWDGSNGFHGSVPIVAGSVPLAVGAALALKMQNKQDISVVYFGDGAIEEGVVHESLNLARQLRAPVLFVCENNLFSSHMHISQRQPKQSVARFSFANDIKNEIIDGNNLMAVENIASEFIESARQDKLPAFIEAITYRHYGHVDWREDLDVGINRSAEDLAFWKSRDPILRLETALFESKLLDQIELVKIKANISNEIDFAWNRAWNDLTPEFRSTLDYLFKESYEK